MAPAFRPADPNRPPEGGRYDLPIFSFLPRALPQTVTLLRDFLPQRGPRNQLDGLLVVAPQSAEPQVVLLTVTAL
ncbi:MAG TPA: hypothetical protein VNL38_01770 [Candidatus Nitrosotenuis sp.]|nr:hypothetical protein [Candidatus Nitrosotenuis sp.]